MKNKWGGVSVIIPIYNTEKYLEKCIESVINQTFKDLEIILINDCSTDGTLEIVKKYEKIDKRIKVINLLENVGQRKGRNIGYEKAEKEYITNIDSDDFLEEDAIEKNFKFMKENNLDIVIYDMYYYFEDGRLKKQNRNKIKNKSMMSGEEAFVASIDWQINSQGIYKKEIVKKFKDDDTFFNGDEVAVRRRFLNSQKVAIGEGKYYYRQHLNSYVNRVNHKVYQYLISNLNLRKEIKEIKEMKIRRKALEKFEATNMSMIANFLKRYEGEKYLFSSELREEIENIFKKVLLEIDKKKAFKYYLSILKPFKFFNKFLKIEKLKLKIKEGKRC